MVNVYQLEVCAYAVPLGEPKWANADNQRLCKDREAMAWYSLLVCVSRRSLRSSPS